MRIRVKRSGGVAGNINYSSPPLEVNSDDLPPDRAKQLRKLVEEANLPGQRAKTRKYSPTRDAMQYEITVEDGGRVYTVEADDDAPAEVLSLVDWLGAEGSAKAEKETGRKKGR